MYWSLIETLNVCWGAIAGTSATDIRSKLADLNQRRRIIRSARQNLARSEAPIRVRRLGVLLDQSWFDLLADPHSPSAQDRIAKIPVAELEKLLSRAGDPNEQRIAVAALATAVWTIVAEDRTIGEVVNYSLLQAIDETTLWLINIGLDQHIAINNAQSSILDAVSLITPHLTEVLSGEPFLAGDVDMARWRMVAADFNEVPSYVERSDKEIEDKLRCDEPLVCVAGDQGTGRTRSLLEALARMHPSRMVFPLPPIAEPRQSQSGVAAIGVKG